METTLEASTPQTTSPDEHDFLPLQGTDYVEFYVGNAKQAAHFYKTAFGFQSLAYAGPETGEKDLRQLCSAAEQIDLCVSRLRCGRTPIADHVYKHGDGVKAIALRVDDATSAWEETTKRGGKSYLQPVTSDRWRRPVRHEWHSYLRRYRSSIHRTQ